MPALYLINSVHYKCMGRAAARGWWCSREKKRVAPLLSTMVICTRRKRKVDACERGNGLSEQRHSCLTSAAAAVSSDANKSTPTATTAAAIVSSYCSSSFVVMHVDCWLTLHSYADRWVQPIGHTYLELLQHFFQEYEVLKQNWNKAISSVVCWHETIFCVSVLIQI